MTMMHSQTGKQFNFDVLVIGSGLAGLNYILSLLETCPHCNIALMTKKSLTESNSIRAQGGVAAVSLQKDSIEQHFKDTLKAGDGLSNETVTREILTAGPDAIQQLLQHGVPFDGHLAKEGGHSERRIHHVGDSTGAAIIDALIKRVKSQKQVHIFENHTAINLIKQKNEVIGCYVLDELSEKIHAIAANVTVLATGGAGKVYRYTSSEETVTGDGIAMAYRAGARLSNLEFYQFHPTLLYHPQCRNFLITEALRGEGAYLINADNHKRFMMHYAPKSKELATRDIVSRAIFNEIEQSQHDFVYLDIRHRSEKFLQTHFPMIFERLKSLGINMHRDMIPVVPAAHYLCGGIMVNLNGQTDLTRLYAIGETACTGLHGANRLASNSLLECAVLSKKAAQASVDWINKRVKLKHPVRDWDSKSVVDLRRATQISAQWVGLRSEMSSYAGIIRTQAGLKDLLTLLADRRRIIEKYYWEHIITRDLIELRNIALIAELIATSAFKRHESRGGHYREDYPQKNRYPRASVLKPLLSSPRKRGSMGCAVVLDCILKQPTDCKRGRE